MRKSTDRLVPMVEVTRLTGMTAAEVTRLIDAGHFPPSWYGAGRAKRWSVAAIDEWMAQREAQPERALSPSHPRAPKGYCVNEAALVRQAPEHGGRFMSADRLRAFAVPVADLLHSHSGIYFLWKGDRIVYVGQTRTGYHRIASHMANSAMDFDAVGFVRCAREDLDKVEREYLDRLLPDLNADPITNMLRRRRAARSAKP